MTDNVVPLQAPRTDRIDATPAIRTPDQYLRAVQGLHDIMARNRDRHAVNGHDAVSADIEEIAVLGEAIQSSPFVFRKGEVVAKGFLPKVVA